MTLTKDSTHMIQLTKTSHSDMNTFDNPFAPTINEIVYNRLDTAEIHVSTASGKFAVGDTVRFFFGSIIRHGRITNAFHKGSTKFYHIEGDRHVWYRGIAESNIISKLYDNE